MSSAAAPTSTALTADLAGDERRRHRRRRLYRARSRRRADQGRQARHRARGAGPRPRPRRRRAGVALLRGRASRPRRRRPARRRGSRRSRRQTAGSPASGPTAARSRPRSSSSASASSPRSRRWLRAGAATSQRRRGRRALPHLAARRLRDRRLRPPRQRLRRPAPASGSNRSRTRSTRRRSSPASSSATRSRITRCRGSGRTSTTSSCRPSGSAPATTRPIVRGDPDSRSWSLVYLRGGRVIALDCINAARDFVRQGAGGGRACRRPRLAGRQQRAAQIAAAGGRLGDPTVSIPAALARRLSIPVIGSPLFIISNPDLVIAQCKAGIIGSFPSLNARPLAAVRGMAPAPQRRTRPRRRALRGQFDRPQVERPADGRPRAMREVQGADGHHEPRRAARGQRGDPFVRRHRPPRRHHRRLRPQGDRQGGRRADRRRRRRRGARGHDLAVRPDPGNPPLVRRAAGTVGVDRHRRRGARGAGDGGRLRLYRLGVHRNDRGARRRPLQGDDRRHRRRSTSSIRACSPGFPAIT